MIEQLISVSDIPVKSELLTLEAISAQGMRFNVPIYQRLYVWESEQIETLLEDILAALPEKEHYYVGTMMIREKPGAAGLFDLVDGQQRFTTFWLIASYLKGALMPFFSAGRICFEIRDFAGQYFANPDAYDDFGQEAKDELQPVIDALFTIGSFFNSDENKAIDRAGFADFLFRQVKMAVTTVPGWMNDNQLFEVLNNRGLQLQHHQVLKSILLEALPEEERPLYGRLWEACGEMNQYIEKNIKDIAGLTWKELLSSDQPEQETGLSADIIGLLKNRPVYERRHLSEILFSDPAASIDPAANDILYDGGNVRSIISFPMLLLHTLRIFLHDKHPGRPEEEIPPVNEKKLIAIFGRHFAPWLKDAEETRNFLHLLFELRTGFDRFVIKWIDSKDKSSQHQVQALYYTADSLQRREPESNDGFALLQSMLYHAQEKITLYWLTPLLHKLRGRSSKPELYAYLRKLDNDLFCSDLDSDLRVRSWRIIGDTVERKYKHGFIHEHKGTGYWRYWFYKLDFILWYYRKEGFKAFDWENYRMTAKNSIEHVCPQHPQPDDRDLVFNRDDSESDKQRKLDDFGNLVLISSGMNSEYHNKPYQVKRAEFNIKKRPDSLKSAVIFAHPTWSERLCVVHRMDMERWLIRYYADNGHS